MNLCFVQFDDFIATLESKPTKVKHIKKQVVRKVSPPSTPSPVFIKNSAVSPTQSGSIYTRKPKTPLQKATSKAFSLLSEKEEAPDLPDFENRVPYSKSAIPSILISKSNSASLELGTFLSHTIPQHNSEFRLVFVELINFIPYGCRILSRTPLRQVIFNFRNVPLLVMLMNSISILIIVLSKLVVSAAKEDLYGQVHLDIPNILDRLLNMHAAISNYIQATKSNLNHAVVPSLPLQLLHSIDTCVYSITTKYYHQLSAKKLYQGKMKDMSCLERYLEFRQ